jgi:hypothetical protein
MVPHIRFFNGKDDFKKRTGYRAISDIDPPPVGFDDTIGIAQPQSGTAAFGGEKRLEDIRCMPPGDSMAFVGENDLDRVPVT